MADLLKPAKPARKRNGSALLDEDADLRRLMENLPAGLREFLDEEERAGQPVPAPTIRALALAEFRGRRPERPDDWRFLYDALRRSVR